MKYLEIYNQKIKSHKKGILKNLFLRMIEAKMKSIGQDSRYAIYFYRILRIIGIDLNKTTISILEVGGGMGHYLYFNHSNIKRKIMIDIDDYYRKEIEDRGIEFYKHDLSDEPIYEIEDQSINIIILCHVIEHINNPLLFISELRRILKKKDSYIYVHQM